MVRHLAMAAGLVLATAATAMAHVEFETGEAPAGKNFRAALKIGHGCDGSPTTSVRVQIPEHVRQATPEGKPDWVVETKMEPLKQPYELLGQSVTEDVREIEWRDGKLPDGNHDTFAFYVDLPPEAGRTVWFPVIQTCETGEHRWIEIPAEGADPESYEEPAPGLKLIAPAN